jgi:hypothetical protein
MVQETLDAIWQLIQADPDFRATAQADGLPTEVLEGGNPFVASRADAALSIGELTVIVTASKVVDSIAERALFRLFEHVIWPSFQRRMGSRVERAHNIQ